MPTISINGSEIEVPAGITIIQACELAGIQIPRFCYHERLAIAGNCRMCLVEVAGGPPKPVASCAMPVADKMQIFTESEMVKKAREGVMEFLLANHPLDCPICDQGGECDLQDQAFVYGKGKSEFDEAKRAVCEKNFGPLVKTQMTRCIHCTRCIRFLEDVAGTCELGASNRGEEMQITTYLEQSIKSELSGNIIDLCPVGALTSKPYAFKARSWELKKTESIDVMDALGSNIRIDSRGLEVMRILPRLNEEINEEWISDKTRFCCDGLKYQRITKPYLKKNHRFEEVSFDEAFLAIAQKFAESSPEKIACLTGQLSAAEEIFALKKLFEKLGSKNFDCRIFGEKFSGKNCAESRFNSKIAGIDEADFCLLIAANPRLDAPVLNARIRKRWLQKNFEIAAFGLGAEAGLGSKADYDLTYPYQNLGNEFTTLLEILAGKHPLCAKLTSAKKPLLILGHEIICGENGELVLELAKKISEKFGLIKDEWNGFNFLSKNSGLLNGLELGFVGNSSANEIVEKTKKGEIEILILHEVDDGIDFSALKDEFEGKFVIYIGSHGDNGAKCANIILPSFAYSEKEATYFNIEGRPQMTRRAIFGPEKARENTEIILELAKRIGIDLGFENVSELRNRLVSSNCDEHLASLSALPLLNVCPDTTALRFSKDSLYISSQRDPKHFLKTAMNQEFAATGKINEISKIAAESLISEISVAQNQDFSALQGKIFNCQNADFYLTNAIARSSLTLNRCSAEFGGENHSKSN